MLTMRKSLKLKGAIGFTVDRIEDIDAVVAEAVKLNKEGKTVVIDAHITPHRPLPVEVLELDPNNTQKKLLKPSRKNTKLKSLYHSASSWKKKGCNHAQLNNSSHEIKKSEPSGLFMEIVNEFKSNRYHRFKCSPSLC